MPQKKTSPNVGINQEQKLPLESEALNPRKRGGQVAPDFTGWSQNIETSGEFPRNTVGQKSKYPLQVSRKGERRV
jgi:hypothetical protein